MYRDKSFVKMIEFVNFANLFPHVTFRVYRVHCMTIHLKLFYHVLLNLYNKYYLGCSLAMEFR